MHNFLCPLLTPLAMSGNGGGQDLKREELTSKSEENTVEPKQIHKLLWGVYVGTLGPHRCDPKLIVSLMLFPFYTF